MKRCDMKETQTGHDGMCTPHDIEIAKNRAAPLLERFERALAAGEITEERWYREWAAIITPAYLAGDNPRAQSGHSGDEARWTHARSLIAEAIHRDGTFLDVGCASGHLMECMVRWASERGFVIEPYGLDIAPELADLAQRRLPHWADRIFVGNAIERRVRPVLSLSKGHAAWFPFVSRRVVGLVPLLRQGIGSGGYTSPADSFTPEGLRHAPCLSLDMPITVC